MDLPVVTPENYYSPEMNMAYMGSTQFKAFEKCEAAALAELRGEYTPPTSQAFLVGGYIDAWFSGELPLYQAQHPEIFKRDGTLKAEYVKAAEIVARLQADELYSMLMSGKKQVIRTGLIAGVPFKVKIDSLLDANTCNMIANRWPHTAAALGFCDAGHSRGVVRGRPLQASVRRGLRLRPSGRNLSGHRGTLPAVYPRRRY